VAADELDELVTLLRYATAGCWAFALYNTVAVREAAVEALRKRLNLPVYEFTFDRGEPNPRRYLEALPSGVRDGPAVVCLYDVERAFPQALGYLDLTREWFLHRPHRLVLWVTEYGRVEVAVEAPNFWAARSGVFDLRVPERGELLAARAELAGEPPGYENLEEWERKRRLYEALLEEYLAEEEVDQAAVARLHYKLATLHYRVGDYGRAEEHLRQELAVEEETGDRAGLATTYNNIASIHYARGDYEAALALYRRSLEMAEQLGDRAKADTVRRNIAAVRERIGEEEGR